MERGNYIGKTKRGKEVADYWKTVFQHRKKKMVRVEKAAAS